MISFLRGALCGVSEQYIFVECGGVGYRVYVSPGTVARLPSQGNEVKVYTHMHVKEDGIALYGFLSIEEIDLFDKLLLTSGVGPKAAMGILGVMTPPQVMLAIVTDDVAALSKAPGIGKKTAQRIVLELRDKIQPQGADIDTSLIGAAPAMASSEKQDAIDALSALGYGRSEGVKAVMEVATPEMSTEQIVKAALKKLVRV